MTPSAHAKSSSRSSSRMSTESPGSQVSPGSLESPLLPMSPSFDSHQVKVVNTFISTVSVAAPIPRRARSCPAAVLSIQSRRRRVPPALRRILAKEKKRQAQISEPAREPRDWTPSLSASPEFEALRRPQPMLWPSGEFCRPDDLAQSVDADSTPASSQPSHSDSASQRNAASTWRPSYSKGAEGHETGDCRPCAFILKGCVSGTDCTFCHLCDPGERLRRKREKKKLLKQGVLA